MHVVEKHFINTHGQIQPYAVQHVQEKNIRAAGAALVSNLVCSEEALPAGMFGFAAAALPNLGLKTNQ